MQDEQFLKPIQEQGSDPVDQAPLCSQYSQYYSACSKLDLEEQFELQSYSDDSSSWLQCK